MWTPADRTLVGDFGSGQALSDDQYRLIEPFIPPPKAWRSSADDRYAADAGRPVLCRAHRLSVAPPAAGISALAYGYFRTFLNAGVWETIRHDLVMTLRESEGREASPTAAIIDTQSVKTTEKGGPAATMPQRR